MDRLNHGSQARRFWYFFVACTLIPGLVAAQNIAPPPFPVDPGDAPPRDTLGISALLDSGTPNEILDAPSADDDLLQQLEETNRRLMRVEEALADAEDKAAEDKKNKEKKAAEDAKKEKKWFEKITVRGYTQVRINEPQVDDDSPARPHHNGDSSIGDNQNFLIRRARLIFYGDVNEHLYFYIQPEFAANVPGIADANQFAQIRDCYADIYLDKEKEYRFRVGQSKVPFGWENLQSSQNRLPLDRNDALNSAVKNERDLGVFFYYTPKEIQDIFKYISDEGLKGSGNYGMFGIGAYNGQGGSFMEQNENLHTVARVTWPFWLFCDQIVEVGMQGYTGKYTVLSAPISPLGGGPTMRPANALETGGQNGIRDERLAWTLVYYPQPLGFQSEWTIGRGPALNDAQTRIEEAALSGGYAMVMYRWQSSCVEDREVIPFCRWNYYKGGYKSERNAPLSQIDEWELGLEWQINKALELTGTYTLTDRTNTQSRNVADTLSYQQFVGSIYRFQLQFNY